MCGSIFSSMRLLGQEIQLFKLTRGIFASFTLEVIFLGTYLHMAVSQLEYVGTYYNFPEHSEMHFCFRDINFYDKFYVQAVGIILGN